MRSPRNWSPSSRSSFSVKLEKPPALGLEVPAFRRGWNGRVPPGQPAPPGPRLTLRMNCAFSSGSCRVPGEEAGLDRIDGAVRRGRQHPAIGGEEVHRELFEGQLRQVFEPGGDPAGFRVREQLADQLGVNPEAVGDHEQPVLVARHRLRRSRSSPEGRRGANPIRMTMVPTLALSGQCDQLLVAELGVGVAAGALPIGGVGIDRQPFGKDQLAGPELGGRRRHPCACGIVNSRSRPDGESASSVVSSPLGDRLEGLPLAFGDRG